MPRDINFDGSRPQSAGVKLTGQEKQKLHQVTLSPIPQYEHRILAYRGNENLKAGRCGATVRRCKIVSRFVS